MKITNPFIDKSLLRLHHLIKRKATGSPRDLALKLNCSERTARSKIEYLREAGLPIAYCKTRHSYYYTQEVELHISLLLGGEEMEKITGGRYNLTIQNNLQAANFLPPNN